MEQEGVPVDDAHRGCTERREHVNVILGLVSDQVLVRLTVVLGNRRKATPGLGARVRISSLILAAVIGVVGCRRVLVIFGRARLVVLAIDVRGVSGVSVGLRIMVLRFQTRCRVLDDRCSISSPCEGGA